MEYIVDTQTIREVNTEADLEEIINFISSVHNIDPEILRKDRKVTITNFDITGKVTTSIVIYEKGITQSPLFS